MRRHPITPVRKARRVNQDALDQMITLRRRGFTTADVAARVGCSERTVRRYTRGVNPQLTPPDPGELDLTRWCIEKSQALRTQAKFDVSGMDRVIRTIHAELAKLDPDTRKWLQADEGARWEFLTTMVWKVAIRTIQDQRAIDEFCKQFPNGDEDQDER